MRKILSVLLLSLFSIGIQAQDLKPLEDPSKVKAAFSAMSAQTQSFSSDFKQTKEFSFMDRPLISTGSFSYQKSDRLRWQYLKPIEYTMLIAGDNIRIRENGKVKTYSSSVNQIFKTVKEIILGCINGEILEDSNYEPSFFESESLFQVKLKPKDAKLSQYMQEINIYLDKKGNELSFLVLKDGSSDSTKIEFLNRQINQQIDPLVFSKF